MLWALAGVTLLIVLGIAIWQRGVIEKAKTTHEHTALTEGRPDQRKSDGSDPGTKAH